jgi:hypothetical protein
VTHSVASGTPVSHPAGGAAEKCITATAAAAALPGEAL